jgi:proteasome lid subunit RPN8/RPN11
MKLTQALLNEIQKDLETAYPNEGCGIMLGHWQTIQEIKPAGNQRTDSARNRYLIDPFAYMKIEREANERFVAVLGIYHSHPDVAARPSQFDLDNAWPNLSYLIVSVVKGKAVEWKWWRLRDDRSAFDEEPVEIV